MKKRKNRKILVAESDPIILELVEFLLKKNKYGVCMANTGHEVLKAALREKPDLILMDVVTPKLDGIAITERLKEDRTTHHIPIILFSCLGQEMKVMRGLQAGAKWYLVKPFSPSRLMEQIKRELE